MSRENDPRTQGSKTTKGKGKHTVDKEFEKDKQAAIESLHDAETEVLEPIEEDSEPEPEPAPKAKPRAKKTTARTTSKPAKAKKPAVSRPSGLPADLPDGAVPTRRYQSRLLSKGGNWYWSYPWPSILDAAEAVYDDLTKVRRITVWYDPATDAVIRLLTPEELEVWSPDVRRD